MTVEVLDDCPAPFPEPKMYVLVRRDLPWPVRTVQAIHAAMEYLHGQSLKDWGRYGPAVVLLGVATEEELEGWHAQLPDSAAFREPDLFDSLTAVAYYGEPTEALGSLRLM